MSATECRSEELAALATAIEKSRGPREERAFARVGTVWCLVSPVPCTSSEPCWRRKRWSESVGTRLRNHIFLSVKFTKLVTGCWENGGSLVPPEHDSFCPSRDHASSRANFPHFPNPLEVTLKIGGTNGPKSSTACSQSRRCWLRVSHLGKTGCGAVTAKFV